MSSKYMGLQPIAYGLFDGVSATPAFYGEAVGFGAVTDSGTGDWTIAVDAQVGLPAASSSGGVNIICSPQQRALAAGSSVCWLIASATALDINSFDLATPTAVDCVTGLCIMKWPN